MTDCINVPWPTTRIDPRETNLQAGYDLADNDLAVWGRHLNKSVTGAVYDITRAGTPRIGQGGGILVTDDANSYYTNANPIPVTPATSSYAIDLEVDANPTGTRYPLVNGSATGADIRIDAAGVLSISFDRATLASTAAGFCNGKGPMRVAGIFDGVNQHLIINRRLIASSAVAPAALVGFFGLGQHGTIRKAQVYRARRTLADEQVSYVRDFARKVVYSWQPHDCGEGPAGGIVTGATGDTWNCPYGDATLKFVWMTEPRLRQKQLALTGVNNQSPCRLEFPHTRMPSFGTWRWGTVARSLAATPEVYLAQLPRQTHAAAASGCYWGRLAVTGGYWTLTWYRENGAAMLTRINTSQAAALGDIVEAAVSRAVDGTWRADVGVNGNWANQGVNAANDVTYLSSNFIGVQPNSGHVLGVVRYQGEMLPGEFPRSDWYAPSLWSLVW